MWDMAAHGLDGLHLADAARHLELLRFAATAWRMGLWPPVFPLIEAPAFLLFGGTYAVAHEMAVISFALCAGAIFGVGVLLRRGPAGVTCGLAASILLLRSPLFHLFGMLVMLELPGTLLFLAALAAYLAYVRTDRRLYLVLTSIATTLVFFCKYNYGILWIVPLIVNEAVRSGCTLRKVASFAWRRLKGPKGRPFALFVAIYVIFLAAIALTGGFALDVAGRRVSVRSVANPASILIWIVVLRFLLVSPRGTFQRLARRWPAMPDRLRVPLCLVVLPVLIWFLDPTHMKGFFGFVENRSSHIPLASAEGLLYYPSAFAERFSPTAGIGWTVLGFAILFACLRVRSHDPAERIVSLCVLFGLVAVGVHRYKDPRFLFTVAPLIWLSFGAAVAHSARVLRRFRTVAETALVIILSAVTLAGGRFEHPDIKEDFERSSIPASVGEPLDAVCDLAAGSAGTLIVGCWNGLSPALVEWHCLLRVPGLAPSSLPVLPGNIERHAPPEVVLDRICGGSRIDEILVCALPADAPAWIPAYEEEAEWGRQFLDAIRRDVRFRNEAILEFSASGYRVWRFSRSQRISQTSRIPSGIPRSSGSNWGLCVVM
jgi:hypothetical protein